MNKLILKVIITILLSLVLIASYFFYSSNNSRQEEQKAQQLTDEELKKEIGQMLLVGFRGTEVSADSSIVKTINELNIGGVVLFDYDVPSSGKTERNITGFLQVKKLISSLQDNSPTPLFVAVDAEGGSVNRLKEKYGFVPIVSAEEMGKDETGETARKESTKLAKELKTLGFNMNLAPVVDVNVNPDNPVIGSLGRSFSSDADEVYLQASEFIKKQKENGIIAVAKHFPGHGSSTSDSHLGLVDVTSTYQPQELAPYQKINSDGLLSAVMTAHIVNTDVDAEYPATLSSKFIQGILRDQIGFEGIVISDDMQMGAIVDNYGFEEAVVKAVGAGCDIITICNNNSAGYEEGSILKARDAIYNAVKSGEIREEAITEAYDRITSLKKEYGIISEKKTAEEIKSQEFELLQSESITFGEALEIAEYVSGKTGIRPAFLLGVLQEELSLEEFDMCYLTDYEAGAGVNAVTAEATARVMNPTRDVSDFLSILKELGKDPAETAVTCPMSFGWGGAMGPADFIPSTWMRYKDKVEAITGKAADPWSISDAFLAAGIYLSESGAKSQTEEGEYDAAMIYFSGSADSPYTWYANGAVSNAEDIQGEIDIIAED